MKGNNIKKVKSPVEKGLHSDKGGGTGRLKYTMD